MEEVMSDYFRTGKYDISFRKMKRSGFCRGCDKDLEINDDVVATYSIRNRGQHIYFCVDCAKRIGEFVKEK